MFTIIGNRMKGRRACWTINGGNRLAALLCRHYSISEVSEAGGFNDCYNSNLPLSAAKTLKTDGKGYEPDRNIPIPSNMKWLKHISFCKPFSDLKF